MNCRLPADDFRENSANRGASALLTRVPQPHQDCSLCPRLAQFRLRSRAAEPDWHNAPVSRFGDPAARLLVVGLAPGLRGANRTGRPFTGDGAGKPLYDALRKYGFSEGEYRARADDGLRLRDCAITNAVRCVPPKNRPTGSEIRNCRAFLSSDIRAAAELRIVLALGRTAHESVIRALGAHVRDFRFAHGERHIIGGLILYSSYHCSRYNMNTRRLTEREFLRTFAKIRAELDAL